MSAENNLSEQDKINILIEKETEERKQREEEIKKARERTARGGEIPTKIRAKAARMRIEEEKKKEKQRKLIEESNTVGLTEKYFPDEMHKMMQSRSEYKRNRFFDAEQRHGKKSKPGWGPWRWYTRKQAGERMRHINDRFFSANVPISDRYRGLVEEGVALDLYPEAKEESV